MKESKLKNNKNIKKILAFAVTILVLILTAFQLYSLSSPEIKTQTASRIQYKDSISSKMIAVRQEEYVNFKTSGVPVSTVKDGERVAKGQTIAAYLQSEKQAQSYVELQKDRDELKRYENLKGQQYHLSLDLSKINSQADNSFANAVDCVNSGDVRNIDEILEQFSDKVTMKQILIGGNIDFTSQIDDLKSDISLLESQVGEPVLVNSNQTGYYASSVDGYENLLDIENLKSLSCADIEKALRQEPQKEPAGNMGKIISGYNWYFVGIITQGEAAGLDFGQKVKLGCESVERGYIDAVVEFKGKNEKAGVPLILKSNIMDADISRLRIEDVEIVVDEDAGLRVSKDAVRVVDGEKGVYILTSGTVNFRKIEIVYSGEDFVISKYRLNQKDEEKEGLFLKLYDEVIVDGKDLEDGKVIK